MSFLYFGSEFQNGSESSNVFFRTGYLLISSCRALEELKDLSEALQATEIIAYRAIRMISRQTKVFVYRKSEGCTACAYSAAQNAVADGTFEKVTPISLHWLRVPERISFKLAVMTYRSIHGTSPSYLQSCFTRVSDMTSRRRLRSSTSHRLDFPPVRLSTVGRRAFPVSGATVWNDLLLHVASAPPLAVFRRLKTFLFSRSYQDTII